MTRAGLLAVCVVSVVCASARDLDACGDKFLRIGRSARPSVYAAVHRASILLYVPEANASQVKKYESFLERAGHRARPVRDVETLSAELSQGRYDLVITPVVQAAQVKARAGAARPTPELLPIVRKTAQGPATDEGYEHVLYAGATRAETLAEIDRVMALRLGARP